MQRASSRWRPRRGGVADPADGRVKALQLTPGGRGLVRRGIRIAVNLDEETFGPGGDPLRETLQWIAVRARAAS